jgi:hypothetical protein
MVNVTGFCSVMDGISVTAGEPSLAPEKVPAALERAIDDGEHDHHIVEKSPVCVRRALSFSWSSSERSSDEQGTLNC